MVLQRLARLGPHLDLGSHAVVYGLVLLEIDVEGIRYPSRQRAVAPSKILNFNSRRLCANQFRFANAEVTRGPTIPPNRPASIVLAMATQSGSVIFVHPMDVGLP